MNCKEVETELRDMLARGVPDKMAVILLTVLGCMVGGSGLFDMLSKYKIVSTGLHSVVPDSGTLGPREISFCPSGNFAINSRYETSKINWT